MFVRYVRGGVGRKTQSTKYIVQSVPTDPAVNVHIHTFINSTEIFVQDIYLFAAHQQNGWARCVINALQNDARRLNLPIRLGVLKVNPAIGFYTRQGFALERADAQYFYLIWRA